MIYKSCDCLFDMQFVHSTRRPRLVNSCAPTRSQLCRSRAPQQFSNKNALLLPTTLLENSHNHRHKNLLRTKRRGAAGLRWHNCRWPQRRTLSRIGHVITLFPVSILASRSLNSLHESRFTSQFMTAELLSVVTVRHCLMVPEN